MNRVESHSMHQWSIPLNVVRDDDTWRIQQSEYRRIAKPPTGWSTLGNNCDLACRTHDSRHALLDLDKRRRKEWSREILQPVREGQRGETFAYCFTPAGVKSRVSASDALSRQYTRQRNWVCRDLRFRISALVSQAGRAWCMSAGIWENQVLRRLGTRSTCHLPQPSCHS